MSICWKKDNTFKKGESDGKKPFFRKNEYLFEKRQPFYRKRSIYWKKTTLFKKGESVGKKTFL